jgi:hypothetical protein
VVERALKALDKPQLEIYLPYGDSWTARILAFFPRYLEKLAPMLVSSGEKGRKKYLLSKATGQSVPPGEAAAQGAQ